MSQIPLVDLKAQLEQIRAEVRAGFDRVLDNTAFILGKDVQEFEQAFARFCAVGYCVGVGNGTDALELAVRALGIGPGDEVIVPTNSFIASALGVARAGATPVLVDCDAEHYMLDLADVEKKLTRRTKAIMPVHLYGQVAPMDGVLALAKAHKLFVIEDAAQAQGAKQKGRLAGSFGDIAATSFYPGKNLGAFGDAGAVLTASDALAKKVRALRNYGSEVKYHHPETGFNSRLDTLQAVVLSAKLKLLAGWNERRRAAADRYHRLLTGTVGVTLPGSAVGNEHIWHLYVVRVKHRDAVLKRLQEQGVGAGIHYPVPMHLQGAFAHLGHKKGDFPVAERTSDELLSLPMYAEITEEQQRRVVDALQKSLG